MKQIVLKLGIYFLICLAITTFVLMRWGGSIDFFYQKFTTPKAKSMIIGDSRSLQGIQPAILNQNLSEEKFELPVFNYSFTGAQAVAGPLYSESIFKKLDTTATNGVFIISVTPEFIVSDKRIDNLKGEFREADSPPHNMTFVNTNPNFEYLIKNINFFHFSGVFRKNTITHKDGWLEESNLPKDKAIFDQWKQGQIDLFLKDRDEYYISDLRVGSLNALLKKLNNYGSAYLVRMPISKEFLTLEESYYPNFNQIIDSIADINDIKYYNFNHIDVEKYKTYDGHHIDKHGGKIFTKDLCDSIVKNELKL